MKHIWKLVVEILVQPGDVAPGLTKGFMNVMTWADSAESAHAKVVNYVRTLNWYVIGIEDARALPDDEEYDDENMQDMLARTRANPNAIILGTFHGYKEN